MRRTADNALSGKDAHLASHLSPAASLEALQQRCPQHRHLNVLRIPKAGSTSFTEMLSSACGKSRGSNQVVELPTSSSVSGFSLASGGGTSPPAPPPWSLSTLWAHEVRPADTCDGLSVTVIREPCERLVSQYRHFEILWGLKLKSHWVRHAPDADAFVGLLRQHWSTIYANPLLPFANTSDGSLPRNYLTTGREKHDVTLLPQALWVGNYTYVICLPQLASAMPALTASLRCRRRADFNRYANHEVDPSQAGGRKYTLSPGGCTATRELFRADAELWDRHCARTMGPQHSAGLPYGGGGGDTRRLPPPVRKPTVPFARGIPAAVHGTLSSASSTHVMTAPMPTASSSAADSVNRAASSTPSIANALRALNGPRGCKDLVTNPIDATPIRSPQDVHSAIARRLVGKTVMVRRTTRERAFERGRTSTLLYSYLQTTISHEKPWPTFTAPWRCCAYSRLHLAGDWNTKRRRHGVFRARSRVRRSLRDLPEVLHSPARALRSTRSRSWRQLYYPLHRLQAALRAGCGRDYLVGRGAGAQESQRVTCAEGADEARPAASQRTGSDDIRSPMAS